MKLNCKLCKKTTRHAPHETKLKRPRIVHNAYTSEKTIIRDVFLYRCSICNTVYGHKPRQTSAEIKGLLPL